MGHISGRKGPDPLPVRVRFWSHVELRQPPAYFPDHGPCAIWTGATQNGGYGKFHLGRGQKTMIAHRLAWLLAHGELPDLPLDHLCRNPGCVNVGHLEPVTDAENMRRAKALITQCPHGHAYTPENTGVRKNGARFCRTCHRLREQRRYRAKAGLSLVTAA